MLVEKPVALESDWDKKANKRCFVGGGANGPGHVQQGTMAYDMQAVGPASLRMKHSPCGGHQRCETIVEPYFKGW